MRPFAPIALFSLLLLLGGCAGTTNLQEVRAFAGESAKLGGYADLSARFRDTYKREQPYLSPEAEQLARDDAARARDAYDDFMKIQKTVVAYMQTLALLAGADGFDLSPQVDAMGAALKASPEFGLDKRHVAAYTGLGRLLARALTMGAQGRAVETMVKEGDADLQLLIDAMITLTRYYEKAHDNEKKIVLGLFETAIPFANKPQDRLLAVLAKAHQQSKANEYRLVERRIALARQGLSKIALGHQKLREQIDTVSSEQTRAMLRAVWRDLRDIRTGLLADA